MFRDLPTPRRVHPRMTTPNWPHATGSTGLHVTSSKNDPDLTTNINYIMDSTETIIPNWLLCYQLSFEQEFIVS